MTNPSDAVGTNGAYGGRTSVDALNDVLGTFNGAGVLSGWNVRADSGMSVLVGGQSGVRDVAVAQDQLGDRTTVNNRLGSPISITLANSSPSTARVDSIVLYVNKPASVSTTTIDNPEACGIIAVSGTTVAPSEADIRSAISADGGTGSTAYLVVIANITIPAGATVITNTNIANNSGKLLAGSTIDWTTVYATGLDTGWVNANSYINTTYFAPRGNIFYRVLGGVVYWAGEVYCHTTPSVDQQNILINLPLSLQSGQQVNIYGSQYAVPNSDYSIWTESDHFVLREINQNIPTTADYQGYNLGQIKYISKSM